MKLNKNLRSLPTQVDFSKTSRVILKAFRKVTHMQYTVCKLDKDYKLWDSLLPKVMCQFKIIPYSIKPVIS